MYNYLDIKCWKNKIDIEQLLKLKNKNYIPPPPPFPPGTIVRMGIFSESETKESKLNKKNYKIIMDYYNKVFMNKNDEIIKELK